MDGIDKKIANARASFEDKINAVTAVVDMTDQQLIEKIQKLQVKSFGGSIMRTALLLEYKRRGLATEKQHYMNMLDMYVDIKLNARRDS